MEDYWWVNDNRLLISAGEKFGLLEKPTPTGERYAMNADGTGQGILIGARVNDNNLGSHVTVGKATVADAAFVEDVLHSDPRHAIVAVWPKGEGGDQSFAKAASLDVNTGQISVLATAPVRRARFTTDLAGGVRFAIGEGDDRDSRTYYRDDAKSDWVLLSDETKDNSVLRPLGFSADGKTAYLQRQEHQGTDTVASMHTIRSPTMMLHRSCCAIRWPIRWRFRRGCYGANHGVLRGARGEVIGVRYLDSKPRVVFFDESSASAKLFRSLEASFPDQAVSVLEYANGGRMALVSVYSDRSPGDYYLFDIENRKAAHLLSHRDWIDPDRMGEQRPIAFKTRDGMTLHGFLTLPAGSTGKNLPRWW